MSMIKILWAGGVSGAVLVGVSLGASWYAACKPACPLARVLDGATHAASRCQPADGFAPLVQRLESARCTATGEVDLVKGGLPDEPMADTAPIVIPEVDLQPGQVLTFPPDSATPPAAPAAGAPTMRYCVDDAPVLPMPRALPAEEEQEEPCEADLRAMFEELVTRVREAETGSLLQGLGVPECREDPNRGYHHNGCPATGRSYNGFTPPYHRSPALEKARRLNEREPMEPVGPTTGVDTMEYRLSDRPPFSPGPGGQ
jgi:hypothetical protein